MSTKKTPKSKAAPKRKGTVPAKRSAVPAHDVASGHWTQTIEPKRTAFISENLTPVHFVIKNHGPGPVFLVAQGGKLMDLSPDAPHATYAHGIISVENRSEKRVLIEFDFYPIFHK
jgi:hypothetical protein